MTPRVASGLMPLLRRMDPERAHGLALRALRAGLAGRAAAPEPMLATTALGLRFATPIGVAAGFDKDAVAVAALRRLGFGFVEVGTVTRQAQAGNPRPRLFRLEADRAIINRMGFNNQGAAAMQARLLRLPPAARPVGVNLGLNKTDAEPDRDYAWLAGGFAALADYLVINVSSPNTPGLRDLQAEERLVTILASLPRTRPPVLVKVAPDLSDAALAAVIETCVDAGVEGMVVSNTTIERPAGLAERSVSAEGGGLSGAPLRGRATAMLARAFVLSAGRLTLVGVGGVETGAQALEKLEAGASLVQVYTAFAYCGPALAGRLNAGLAAALRGAGHGSVAAAVGTRAAAWAG